MKIETKFGVGDRVFTVESIGGYRLDPCLLCLETGLVDIKGGSYRCPLCHGNGKTRVENPLDLKVIAGKVESINLLVEEGEQSEDYSLEDSDFSYSFDELFATEEEALVRVKERIAERENMRKGATE